MWDPEVAMWIAIAAMAIGPSVAWAWVATKKSQHENDLKQSMVDRGMSASEIERVLAAGKSEKDRQPSEGDEED